MNPNFDMNYTPEFAPNFVLANEQPEQPVEQELPHFDPPVVVTTCTIA